MKINTSSVLLLAGLLLLSSVMLSCGNEEARLSDGLYAKMETSRGTMYLQLEFEKAPLTVANFVGLVEGTIAFQNREPGPYFDGLTFHRVEPGFVVQGGDPMGDGTGGPGYQFPDELNGELRHEGSGVLSMANSGPNTNGSQFFITLDAAPHLDNRHTVFGHVAGGQGVIKKIKQGDKIERVTIVRIGEAAEAYRADQTIFDNLMLTAWSKVQPRSAPSKPKQPQFTMLDMVMARWPDAVTTESGLSYVITQKGTGEAKPPIGATVYINYTGKLLDDRVFDTSLILGKPKKLELGGKDMIAGLSEALSDMTQGEQRILIIPPELAYGEKGFFGTVPPDAHVIIDVELVEFAAAP